MLITSLNGLYVGTFYIKFKLLLAKSYAAGRANNTELLMLVSDVKVNSRLKILKGIFSGIHGMPLMRVCRK